MRTLDIKYYALVHAIAESGSAKGAAALLNLTQSAISHRMREMERRLAITLFERRGHKVYLTPAAHRLLSTAREIIPKMIDAERDAVVLAQSAQPALRWGIDAHDVVQQLLTNDFDMLESNIGISRATDGELASLLLDGEIDLALFNEPPMQRGIVNNLLFTDVLVAVVPAQSSLARLAAVNAQQMAACPYVTYSPRPRSGYEFELFFHPAGEMPKRLKIIESVSLVLETIAQAQKGVTILSSWQADTRRNDQRLAIKTLDGVAIEIPWYLSYREDVTDKAAIKKLMAALKEQPS